MIATKAIAESLLQDRSKASLLRQVDLMHEEEIDLEVFIRDILTFEQPARWYLTWTLSHFLERFQKINPSALNELWQLLKTCAHDGMERDLWRSLSFVAISEELSGEVYDRALQTMRSSKNAIAVRAHSMFVAFNIAQPYPELRRELAQTLETIQEQNDSAGLYSRSKNLRKKLERLDKR